MFTDGGQCVHVALQPNLETVSEEPSPTSDAGPVTPTPAGHGNDFILFDSPQGPGLDMTEDALFSELESIEAIAQVELLFSGRFELLTYQ